MAQRIYLDWNATAPLRPQARAVMAAALDVVGNPSSVHAEGRAARHLVEEARRQVAALVGAEPRNVVFTSGGTEANMLALSPAIGTGGAACDRLLVSAIEHPSVLAGGRFPAAMVEQVSVTSDGCIDLAALAKALAAPGGRPLLSLMLANNETGVLQPVSEAAAMVHEAGGLLHVDAVQAAGRVPCDINAIGADLMTVSSHKIGGPKGVGALVLRSQAVHLADPLIKGGGQERGARAGTENVAGIAGFGAAAAAALEGLVAGRRAHDRAAPPAGARASGHLARGHRVRGAGRALAQYDAVRGARHEGGNRRDCLRPGGGCGIIRSSLLVRQGRPLACACRHGGSCSAGARRGPRQPRPHHDRIRR